MNFVHLSDTHLLHSRPAPGGTTYDPALVADDGSRLRAALKAAVAHPQRPDFVILTGDLVHEGEAEDYRFLRSILEECCQGIPYYVCLGNHDRHAAFWEGFMGESGKSAPYVTTVMQEGLRIVILDSSPEDGDAVGTLPQEQLDYLRDELKTSAPKGTVVLLHHPPLGNVMESMDDLCPRREELCELLAGGEVKAVFSGHTHFFTCNYADTVLYATAASTVMSMDNRVQSGISFIDTCSFNIGRITAQGVQIGFENLYEGHRTLARITPEMMAKMMEA